MKWELKPGVKPSKAVSHIFDVNTGNTMDCLSLMSAIYYRTILKVCQPDKFDKMFEIGKCLNISAPRQRHGERHPVFDNYTKLVASTDNPQVGDWLYVKGHPDYFSPEMNCVLGEFSGGARGENVVYMGDEKFSALLHPDKTLDQIRNSLIDEYNAKVDEYNQKRPGAPKKHATLDDDLKKHMVLINRHVPDFERICKCGEK
jgi:hypothetical protein